MVRSTDGYGGGMYVEYYRSYVFALIYGVRIWLEERRRWNNFHRDYKRKNS